MGITYRSDPGSDLTVSVIDGTVSGDEVHAFAQRQDADPAWHATTRLLSDARTSHMRHVTAAELHAFADLYAQMRRNDRPFRAAIVADKDFELAGRYGDLLNHSGASRTIAFTSLTTACIWLDIDLATVRATIAQLRDELSVAKA
ncbi:MAG TPA: hypothetical protein VN636_14805 [Acidimicrobiia bacterium]|nr:hypothetical protein [Acidimicrobiia bacterium]